MSLTISNFEAFISKSTNTPARAPPQMVGWTAELADDPGINVPKPYCRQQKDGEL